MKKKISQISLMLLLLLLFSGPMLTGQNDLKIKRNIIGVPLSDYRMFLKSHPQPLDRLFILKGIGYFLVDESGTGDLLQSGLNIISLQALPSPPREDKHLKSATSKVNGAYHSYSETNQLLKELAEQHPDLTKLITLGKSVEGREIIGIKISDNASQEENEPNIYFMGCHHAREWISVEMPLLFARYLLEKFQSKENIRALVNQAQIYIIPLVNPDGLEYSIYSYRMWRKNRRYLGNFIWGVDLNRNYGYKWGYDDEGSSPEPAGETYRGPAPFSEPETVAIREFMQQFKPAGSISFHNYGNLILYPWGYTGIPCPDDAEFHALAREMRDRIYAVNHRSYVYGSGALAIYPTNGDTDDWIYGIFGVPAFTIELPPDEFINGGFVTSEEEIGRTFAEMLPAMLYFTKQVIVRTPNLDSKKAIVKQERGKSGKVRR